MYSTGLFPRTFLEGHPVHFPHTSPVRFRRLPEIFARSVDFHLRVGTSGPGDREPLLSRNLIACASCHVANGHQRLSALGSKSTAEPSFQPFARSPRFGDQIERRICQQEGGVSDPVIGNSGGGRATSGGESR